MYGYIYKITNKIDNKIYIGQHKYNKPVLDENYICSGLLINKAIEKYGIVNFEREIIDTADDKEELNNKEKYYIKLFNSFSPNGYNLTSGGDGAPDLNEESRKKMAYWKGKKQPEESNIKRREKQKGSKKSKEWCLKISKSLKNSEKNKAKAKEAYTARKLKYSGKIICSNGEDEIIIDKDSDIPKGYYHIRTKKFKELILIKDDIINFYKNHSMRQTCSEFNIDSEKIKILLDYYHIKLHSKNESIMLSNISNYGVQNVMDIPEIKEKHKNSMKHS